MKYEKLSIHFQFTTFILYIFSFVLKFSKWILNCWSFN
jgi:hypothetical protein